MRVFITGATGFVGSAIVPELLNAGHQVLGLARSDQGAKSLIAAGAEAHRGDLKDLESLRHGAAMSDGVIHAAFNHDFSKFAENAEVDRRAIEVIGEVLEGSDRPLIVTSGLPLTPDRLTTEDDVPPSGLGETPRVSEQMAISMVARGVRASVVRMSQAHNRDKQGLATYMIEIAREKGISAYVGTGLNRWSAVHRLDVAPLYRLALEQGSAGARYHAIAEEGVPVREIAEAIGRGLKIPVVALSPEEAASHFGWLGFPVSMDAPASSALTQQRLGWHPTEKPGFIADLECSSAFED
ncbi:SDR family oxidoreductase [Nodosilinea sp. LEGE 07088]|uniref:SDR family oxidoreductase n=1 Tax=Nodosilinea sp. LEGE 07088 TaxID=2777968 RepID=UPI001881481A|nr:SDR family oxidoreductase [Nodosilinea sp. LEGE 07088]MBE9136205.1 SDR family oxidoreductase [Nodosilinea sp. LEGE 07088]